MSDRLEAVKAQFDAMIERMKEEVCRQVDRDMEILLEMWREEKRRQMKKNPTRSRSIKRMHQDKAGGEDGGGQLSEDSNRDVKEELPDEDAAAQVASTSGERKRQTTPARNMPTKKLRVDSELQQSAASGRFKKKTITIDCTVEACKCTFRCVHKMREHLLTVHQVKPFQCRAQGCGQQFDKKGEFMYHGRAHPRATTTWLCPHCPNKTFTTGRRISSHLLYCHQTGQFQCTVDQCQFIGTTRSKLHTHQWSIHSPTQYACSFNGCHLCFKNKYELTQHQITHITATPFRCTVIDCGYRSKKRHNVVRHIRSAHFKLPKTLKKQHRRGIVDHRNPSDFIEVDEEALQSLES